MKYLLLFWGIPVGFLALWYGLSINDMHMGMHFFSREFNDRVFNIYAGIFGIDPQVIRDSLMKTLIIDSIFVCLVVYFKPFSRLKNWWKNRNADNEPVELAYEVEPASETRIASVLTRPQAVGLSPLSENNLSSAP